MSSIYFEPSVSFIIIHDTPTHFAIKLIYVMFMRSENTVHATFAECDGEFVKFGVFSSILYLVAAFDDQ